MNQEADDVKIMADPTSTFSCNFTVDRPVNPSRSYYFPNKEKAKGSPLAERLFDLEGVSEVLISHEQVTVTKNNPADWRPLATEIGATIRSHLGSGDPAVAEERWQELPSEQEIRERVQTLLDSEINPAVAAHGGGHWPDRRQGERGVPADGRWLPGLWDGKCDTETGSREGDPREDSGGGRHPRRHGSRSRSQSVLRAAVARLRAVRNARSAHSRDWGTRRRPPLASRATAWSFDGLSESARPRRRARRLLACASSAGGSTATHPGTGALPFRSPSEAARSERADAPVAVTKDRRR